MYRKKAFLAVGDAISPCFTSTCEVISYLSMNLERLYRFPYHSSPFRPSDSPTYKLVWMHRR